MTHSFFAARKTIQQVEEGNKLAPKFDENGLIPCVVTDNQSGELLMHGYMNQEALARSITSGEAHYYSRARKILWHKGANSGMVQKIIEMRIDDDQDCIWLRVAVAGIGASCHVGYRSCFYRTINPPVDGRHHTQPIELTFAEHTKVFVPEQVYGDVSNPTKL